MTLGVMQTVFWSRLVRGPGSAAEAAISLGCAFPSLVSARKTVCWHTKSLRLQRALPVEISFKNAKLAKMLNEEAQLRRAFDAGTARQIRLRLAVLAASATLADVPVRPPDGRHQLKGNPEQHFAVYAGPERCIVFEPATPAPKMGHGRLDLRKVAAIIILDIVRQD